MKIMSIEKIDEVTASGFGVGILGHGFDFRRLRKKFPLTWGWSWESALYLSSRRFMITLF